MNEIVIYLLAIVSAVCSGLMAGFFFAFSVSIMGALSRMHSEQGIAVMQQINIVVINPVFLTAFFGTALVSFASGVASFFIVGQNAFPYLLTGGLVYTLGSFLVTIVCNVPRNNALAVVDSLSDKGAVLWSDYLKEWTMWNHVRTVASLLAAILFTLAVRLVA